MIEFSCQYIPRGHYFVSTLWLWSTNENVFVFLYFERKSTFNNDTKIKALSKAINAHIKLRQAKQCLYSTNNLSTKFMFRF